MSDNNTNETANTTDEFAGIPGADPEKIRADLLATGDVPFWRPHGNPDGTATDFESYGEAGQKALKARLAIGPGPNGTEWQHALHEHHLKLAKLDNEEKRILAKLDSVSGYDRDTGKGISAIPDSERKALSYALAQVVDERVRLEGEAGREALNKKLDEAVKATQQRLKREHMVAEAKRRAKAKAMDDEIERLAQGFAKTQPKP